MGEAFHSRSEERRIRTMRGEDPRETMGGPQDYRVEGWRRDFPLRPGPLTGAELREAVRKRSEWVLGHPEFTALDRWSAAEREHFVAVGRLIEASYGAGGGPTS